MCVKNGKISNQYLFRTFHIKSLNIYDKIQTVEKKYKQMKLKYKNINK